MIPQLQIIVGDALTELQKLPSESVHCCVTSPPYWGLRDYGTAEWEGGGDNCDHQYAKGGRNPETASKQLTNGGTIFSQYEHECKKCGAKRIDSQLGLEKTPEEYVAKMVEVLREVKRALRKNGTLWLNLGDSYNNVGGGTAFNEPPGSLLAHRNEAHIGGQSAKKWVKNLKPKDLVGIPWRVALALQADGWYLRSDIIWSKPNPMPESVTDRPTKSHEYIFLLTKNRQYFYDAEAIREDGPAYTRLAGGYLEKGSGIGEGTGGIDGRRGLGFRQNDVTTTGRNKRSVWTVATAPYPEAHFATYPPDLIKPCILAGTSVGGIVLDPFAGSGTTGAVALELGRSAILIELSPKYAQLIEQRCSLTLGLALA